jgi:hypothetical protein
MDVSIIMCVDKMGNTPYTTTLLPYYYYYYYYYMKISEHVYCLALVFVGTMAAISVVVGVESIAVLLIKSLGN